MSPDEAELLLDIAESTIVAGLVGRQPSVPSADALPPALATTVGAFVTLTVGSSLNGCIGTVDGAEPLGVAVARLAWSAAFADPRLPALTADDYSRLTIDVSVLSALSPLAAGSRDELVDQLRPGIDGVVVRAGRRQGLFLPAVWKQLPDPDDFVDQLHVKAGLSPRVWRPDLEARRFTTTIYTRGPAQCTPDRRIAASSVPR